MSKNEGDFGVEMRRLFDELSRLTGGSRSPSAIDGFGTAKRKIDDRRGLMRSVRYRRSELLEERRWIESEIHGFERALVLVGQAVAEASGVEGHRADVRLRDKLCSRVERLGEVDQEIHLLDRRVSTLVAEIEELQDVALEALRHAVELAEEEKRAAEALRVSRITARYRRMGEVEPDVMWSPTPVYGYRVWVLDHDGYHGARERWLGPEMAATCPIPGDVPHTDGRCALVAFGCGIYAAKSVEDLMEEVGGTRGGRFAVGLVALKGKVVEHDRGYRAEVAAVRVLVVVDRGTLRVVDVDVSLHDLFKDPSTVAVVASRELPEPDADDAMTATIRDYLEERAERLNAWT
ncbi:MAG: hypothetical protein GXP36_10610 [Actinobacteria bacterium]|nr:hypothetical protein [Actinomycetota bacterium]